MTTNHEWEPHGHEQLITFEGGQRFTKHIKMYRCKHCGIRTEHRAHVDGGYAPCNERETRPQVLDTLKW